MNNPLRHILRRLEDGFMGLFPRRIKPGITEQEAFELNKREIAASRKRLEAWQKANR